MRCLGPSGSSPVEVWPEDPQVPPNLVESPGGEVMVAVPGDGGPPAVSGIEPYLVGTACLAFEAAAEPFQPRRSSR